MVGAWLTVDQVMDAVRRDSDFYEKSGGGVTFSGGEPTTQPRFLETCASRCRKAGIHTALDTCGYAEWKVLAAILPHIDLVLFDLKHMNSRKHERLTGVDNELILKNLRRIDSLAKPIWIRLPLIPGHNDSEENLRAAAELIRQLGAVQKISILPYNTAAGARYSSIGQEYDLEGLGYSKDREGEALRIFSSAGLAAVIRD
jgi:pyruvate formate lyase activating enzyme